MSAARELLAVLTLCSALGFGTVPGWFLSFSHTPWDWKALLHGITPFPALH